LRGNWTCRIAKWEKKTCAYMAVESGEELTPSDILLLLKNKMLSLKFREWLEIVNDLGFCDRDKGGQKRVEKRSRKNSGERVSSNDK